MNLNKLSNAWYLLIAVPLFFMASCGGDDDTSSTPAGAPIASFQPEYDTVNFLSVKFNNFSQNASSYSWEFGDGNTSTDESPTHVYTEGGTYSVTLTAKNAAGASATQSKDVTVTDPGVAAILLTGTTSKTWKLFREGTSMSLGESDVIFDNYWPGLKNDGTRDCLYEQTFTFAADGSFTFDDAGSFWGEFGVWADTDPNYETCFPAEAANMVNKNGADVSAWLSGSHQFSYDPTSGVVTLNGNGSWMGIPKLGATEERLTPSESTSFKVVLTEETGYDLMTLAFDYTFPDGGRNYWRFVYVSYSDASLEPALGSGGGDPFGEDLPNQTPTELFNNFNSTGAGDVVDLVPTASDVTITAGVTDPDNAAGPKVGEYVRGTAAYADLKFQLAYDAQFDNFDSVTVEVYFPSTNDYSGNLSQQVDIFIADASQTEQFWTGWELYVDGNTTVQDQWVRFSFPLGEAKNRADLDLIGLKIGGENHAVDGTFYVRNFIFK